MDNREIRYNNLVYWAGKLGRNTLSEKAGWDGVGYLNRMMSRYDNVGANTARKLELALDLPNGWFDLPHPELWEQIVEDAAPRPVAVIREESPENSASIVIPRLSVRGSMGHGAMNPQEDIVDKLSVSRRYLTENFIISAPMNLRLITGRGDSMSPTICDGDIILVDTGVTQINIDAVFVLARGDELFIKRIQRRLDGSFLVISDNKAYDPYPLKSEDFDSLKVCGRAINVWNGRKL